jgi:hypothetical protein
MNPAPDAISGRPTFVISATGLPVMVSVLSRSSSLCSPRLRQRRKVIGINVELPPLARPPLAIR